MKKTMIVLAALLLIGSGVAVGSLFNQTYFAEVEVLFTYPGVTKAIDDNPMDRIVQLIQQFNQRAGDGAKQIEVAAYVLTSNEIRDALLQALDSGTALTVISESRTQCNQGSDLQALQDAGAFVIVNDNSGLMHHKFMLLEHVDGEEYVVITGSFNFSAAADEDNFENVTIFHDRDIYQAYFWAYHNMFSEFPNAALRSCS